MSDSTITSRTAWRTCFHRAGETTRQRKITPVNIDGSTLSCLVIRPADLSIPFDVTFDAMFSQMSQLPSMFIELDGSFVWRGESEMEPWQLDGTVFELAGKVIYIETNGWCPRKPLTVLLQLLARESSDFVVQMLEWGVMMSLDSFASHFFGPSNTGRMFVAATE